MSAKTTRNYAKSMGESVRDFTLKFFDDLDPRQCQGVRRWLNSEARKGRRVSLWRPPPNGALSDVAIVGDLSSS